MKILASIVLILTIFGVFSQPFLFGKEREPFSPKTWIWSIVSAGLIIPLCLRILGII